MSPHHTERDKDMRFPLLIHYWALEVGAAQVIEEMRARALWLMNGELIEDGPGPQVTHDYRWGSWNIAKNKPEKAVTILTVCREKWKPAGVQIQHSKSRTSPYRHARGV